MKKDKKDSINESKNHERLYIATFPLGEFYKSKPIWYYGFFMIKGELVKGEEVHHKRLHSMAENGDNFYVPIMICDDDIREDDKFLISNLSSPTFFFDEIKIADNTHKIKEWNNDPDIFKLSSNEEVKTIRDLYLDGKLQESSNNIEFMNYDTSYEFDAYGEYFE